MGWFKHCVIVSEVSRVNTSNARNKPRNFLGQDVHEEVGAENNTLIESLRVLDKLLRKIVDEILIHTNVGKIGVYASRYLHEQAVSLLEDVLLRYGVGAFPTAARSLFERSAT
jgi:hypothetical protein